MASPFLDLALQGLQLILIRYITGQGVGKLKVDRNDPLVNPQKIVEPRIPMNNPLFRKQVVYALEFLGNTRIPQLFS